MALSATVLGNLIDTNLNIYGAVGINRTIFSNAIATGIVNHIVGAVFITTDIGTGTNGTGLGNGVTSLSAVNMRNIAIATMISTGINAQPTMDAIMQAVVNHLSSASILTSTHPQVGFGSGIINVGTIGVTIGGMEAAINAALNVVGANGVNRQNLSLSIATGVVTDILASGTGTVVISGGSGTGGSGGTGTGTIS